MKRPAKMILAGLAVAAGLAAARFAAAAEKREVLSRHETIAEFTGTRAHRCPGLTALCPDRCGHSGTLASFRILGYVRYEKSGEYGDPPAERFEFLVEDNRGKLQVPAAVRDAVRALKPGDRVRLTWNHEYVTKDGVSSPERPIVKLEKTAAETDAAVQEFFQETVDK